MGFYPCFLVARSVSLLTAPWTTPFPCSRGTPHHGPLPIRPRSFAFNGDETRGRLAGPRPHPPGGLTDVVVGETHGHETLGWCEVIHLMTPAGEEGDWLKEASS